MKLNKADRLDAWAKSAYRIVEGNTLEAFQPLDFWHFNPLWYDLFFEKIDRAIAETATHTNRNSLLPPPSSTRSILFKLLASLPHMEMDPAAARRVLNFFFDALEAQLHDDHFAMSKNLKHAPEEVAELVDKIDWQPATPTVSKLLGKLFTAATSLVHGLYNDWATDNGIDIYGPYEITNDQGEPEILLIRHFPNLRTEEMWPENTEFPVKELVIYQRYRPIDITISFVGVHTVINGNPIESLKSYAIEADGRMLTEEEIAELSQVTVQAATSIYGRVRQFNFEELKQRVLEQENYQLKQLFTGANIDWRPSAAKRQRIAGQPFREGLYPMGRQLTFEEFTEKFGINKAKELFR